MRHQKRKSRTVIALSQTNRQLVETLGDDIGGDVFELWLGISRLMAKVHGGPPGIRPPRQTAAARRSQRRRAA
jgi:hypothetical protein